MSHRAVSKTQMGEQLKMFMTPDELIDTTNKMDSMSYDVYDNRSRRSPREQWEHPMGGTPTVHGEEPFVRDRSLREEKLAGIEKRPDFQKPYASTPPVELTHYGWGSKRPLLSQGHHRLAHAEAKGHPFLAVTHHVVK
jgi:hypothetical protein